MHAAPQDLAERTTVWVDRWYDPEAQLLWNPPGSFTGELPDRSVHLVPGSAWYAAALLQRGEPGDHERATEVLGALLDLQYDRPGTVWHGTFARFAEWPEPCEGHETEWIDYDPNWRQFVGATFLVILRHFEEDLNAALVDRLDGALRRCVQGEGDRVTARYTNIALMKAGLEVEAGHRLDEPEWVAAGHALADAIVARFDRVGAFDEYNSPTYYGIDFMGLAFWRSSPVSDRLRTHGRRLEHELWREVARWYHPGLRNLCGPYSRSYGMDMNRYVAALSVWLWAYLGADAAPMPSLDAEVVPHGHDLAMGAVVALLAGDDERELVRTLISTTGDGARTVDRELVTPGHARSVSGWLGPTAMLGGETNDHRWHGWLQYHPATAHWRESAASVASFRFVADAPIHARAHGDDGRGSSGAAAAGWLEVTVQPHPVTRIIGCEVWFEGDGLRVDGITNDRWDLPGLQVEVRQHGPDQSVLDRVDRVDATHVRASYVADPLDPGAPVEWMMNLHCTTTEAEGWQT